MEGLQSLSLTDKQEAVEGLRAIVEGKEKEIVRTGGKEREEIAKATEEEELGGIRGRKEEEPDRGAAVQTVLTAASVRTRQSGTHRVILVALEGIDLQTQHTKAKVGSLVRVRVTNGEGGDGKVKHVLIVPQGHGETVRLSDGTEVICISPESSNGQQLVGTDGDGAKVNDTVDWGTNGQATVEAIV